jgi:hypothetical protein
MVLGLQAAVAAFQSTDGRTRSDSASVLVGAPLLAAFYFVETAS